MKRTQQCYLRLLDLIFTLAKNTLCLNDGREVDLACFITTFLGAFLLLFRDIVGHTYLATVMSARQLSYGCEVKKTVELCLDVQGSGIEYQPGDTVGVIPQNSEDEVQKIMKHLKILERADTVVTISVKPGTVKKKACVPPYIPVKATLRHILQTCLDIRAVPKKTFLRVLAAHTEDPSERCRLEKLCSKEGSADYSEFVVTARNTLLDLLETFPSCCPPVEVLLEHLPRLQARPYSIASSPLQKKNGCTELHIIYSLLEFPASEHGAGFRYGTCTGWLDYLTRPIQTVISPHDSVSEELKRLTLKDEFVELKVPLYLRKSTGFNLPTDPSVPIILIGPGTGVAPFMGFLRHRQAKQRRSSELVFGEVWLFFGCRFEDKDFLYRSELEKYIEDGILTHLFVSFSREKRGENVPHYVQDNIKLCGRRFVKQVFEKSSSIYVCGDAKNMGKDVLDAIVSVIQNEKDIEEQKARLMVTELQSQGRYLQDIWI
ncbi:methionine synthase reductase-like isoform X2 [Zootermopsis nevadensis]|uniref:methionine synthase reductase-like isoform X2 n=1 Tax=Zootermopsis nevadensis TaxID=136037 RepID=UPI000B8E9885|nr:methionine synthase reductase-like isoform X2 [Zootermopsis nevadensis]